MKILIVNNNMQVGGIQKSLLNLVNEISHIHDVTLLLFHKSGALLDEIDENVNIISGNLLTRVLGMSQADAAAKGKLTALFRGICVLLTRAFGSGFVYRLLSRFQKVSQHFDVAISFMQNSAQNVFYGGCNEFVLNSVKADKRLAFIHCDFESYPGNTPYNVALYESFDSIACVSDSVRKVFARACPACRKKTFTVYNMYNFEYMSAAASEYPVKRDNERVMLFTSARISEEKGIMRMFPILSQIKKIGGKFVWYIAGYGPEYEKALEAVKNCGLEEEVVFLGLKKNPYPYFKNADLLLVPSYNEAAPMVYMEALYFATPVFTTDTTSAHEFITEDNGWIAENTDSSIKNKLTELILSDEIYKKKPSVDATNEKALRQLEQILRSM